MQNLSIRHIDESCEGFTRKKYGDSFTYLDENGVEISSREEIDRIENLVIPPNWEKVWICSDNKGHIQAYGFDEKGRKQYIYHPEWMEYRNKEKFNRLFKFGRCLPAIRKKAYLDADRRKWSKNKVLGLVTLTLDDAYIRIGNKYYKKRNETYGLTTLRRRHIHFGGEGLRLEFKAKSNKYRKVNIKNNHLVNLIKKSADLPGYEIFRYKENGKFNTVDSQDVNDYLKGLCEEEHTAKDFRTWGGTVLALEKVEEARNMIQENKRLKFDTTVVKLVARELGNTQAICRDYYIHPAIMEPIKNKDFDLLNYKKTENTPLYGLTASEEKVMQLISP